MGTSETVRPALPLEDVVTEPSVALFDYADTGSGPALLLLPGSFGTGSGWKAVMGHLGEGYRVVTTSLLGYGAGSDAGRTLGPGRRCPGPGARGAADQLVSHGAAAGPSNRLPPR